MSDNKMMLFTDIDKQVTTEQLTKLTNIFATLRRQNSEEFITRDEQLDTNILQRWLNIMSFNRQSFAVIDTDNQIIKFNPNNLMVGTYAGGLKTAKDAADLFRRFGNQPVINDDGETVDMKKLSSIVKSWKVNGDVEVTDEVNTQGVTKLVIDESERDIRQDLFPNRHPEATHHYVFSTKSAMKLAEGLEYYLKQVPELVIPKHANFKKALYEMAVFDYRLTVVKLEVGKLPLVYGPDENFAHNVMTLLMDDEVIIEDWSRRVDDPEMFHRINPQYLIAAMCNLGCLDFDDKHHMKSVIPDFNTIESFNDGHWVKNQSPYNFDYANVY